jgi:hypothetical protein
MTQPRYLIALLLDISASMTESMANERGGSVTRLENLRDAIKELVARGRDASAHGGDVGAALPLANVVAYGFGFGNPLAALLGRSGQAVRDLLVLPGSPERAIPVAELAERWPTFERHIDTLLPEMFGSTPMRQAFDVIASRLRREMAHGGYTIPPVIFILSDGDPTDGTSAEVAAAAEQLRREMETTIVSCYITDEDIGEPRVLYNAPQPHWSEGARLMFECASEVADDSSLLRYLREYRWRIAPHARLFTQANHSVVMGEFLNMVLNRSEAPPAADRPINVFITYSHRDAAYVQQLTGFLRDLNSRNIAVWHDANIVTGDQWEEAIRRELGRADIAVALISQDFLNSRYCQDVEISKLLRRRRDEGLRIYPVILRPCNWQFHQWLANTQFLPRDGQTVEENYPAGGARERIYVQITNELASLADELRRR